MDEEKRKAIAFLNLIDKSVSSRGDIWLNRFEAMKKIYLNSSESDERRIKAFAIAFILNQRIIVLCNFSQKIMSIRNSIVFSL